MDYKNQLAEIINLQRNFNQTTTPDWIEKAKNGDYWYSLALCQEVAELQQVYGFAWWKPSDTHINKFHAELIDVAHLLISHNLSRIVDEASSIDEAVTVLAERIQSRYLEVSTMELSDSKNEVKASLLSLMASVCGNSFSSMWVDFFRIMQETGMDFEKFIKHFKAKNALNVFRFHNNYADGSYVKQWGNGESKISDSQFVFDHVEKHGLPNDLPVFLKESYAKGLEPVQPQQFQDASIPQAAKQQQPVDKNQQKMLSQKR